MVVDGKILPNGFLNSVKKDTRRGIKLTRARLLLFLFIMLLYSYHFHTTFQEEDQNPHVRSENL